MPALRELQRERRARAILQAAESLFRSRGYSKTTMDSIAEAAEVGVATVYNYFGSKERVLVELFRPIIERSFTEAKAVLLNLPPDPCAGVTALLHCYRHIDEAWNDRVLLRSLAATGLGVQGLAHDLIARTDEDLRRQIEEALTRYKSKQVLIADLDVKAASEVIFAVFNQYYYRFLQSDKMTFRAMFHEFSALLPVLFSGWRVRSF